MFDRRERLQVAAGELRDSESEDKSISSTAVGGHPDTEVPHARVTPRRETGAELEPLLEPLRQAARSQRLTLALGLWRRTDPLALLPFQLHGPWCDRISELPLNIDFALLPFGSADLAAARKPWMPPGVVKRARTAARRVRESAGRALPHDIKPPDWEIGYDRHRSELGDEPLGGASFVEVNRVQPDGRFRALSRELLGRFAPREGVRPSLLTPGKGVDAASGEAGAAFASVDVLFVNLQDLRGERTGQLIKSVLSRRGAAKTTLVVTSSPSDLLFFNPTDEFRDALVLPLGEAPEIFECEVEVVDEERLQNERMAAATLHSLDDRLPQMAHLIRLGTRAWWAANQFLLADPQADPAVRRYLSAVDDQKARGLTEAQDLAAFTRLLVSTVQDEDRIRDRTSAVVRRVLRHLNSDAGGVTVLVRDPLSAQVIRDAAAAELQCASSELVEWGVEARTARAQPSALRPALLLGCGFSGYVALDAFVAARAPKVHLILDPLEAAFLHMTVQRMAQWLRRANVPTGFLDALAAPVARYSHLHSEQALLDVRFDVTQSVQPPLTMTTIAGSSPSGRHLVICFVDGTEQVTEERRKFDRLDPDVGVIETVAAADLQPGDDVVLTDGSASFSQLLIDSLDRELLAEPASRREAWVRTVEALGDAAGLTIAELHRRLVTRGVDVDYQSVRAWTKPTENSDRVPARWEHFVALAGVLGLDLPEKELHAYFAAIKLLRTKHRKAGRDLVRMLRAARAGRLSPVALHSVEAQFGITVRQLVAATRLSTIDDIREEG